MAERWHEQQLYYSEAYVADKALASVARLKLAERLQSRDVWHGECMPDELIEERIRTFGLPEFDAVYEGLRGWLAENSSVISGQSIGLRLYEQIKKQTV